MRALLDVNVLIALLDAAHIHHRVTRAWMEEHVEAGWASCPITQNGCIRIMSQAAYPGARPAAAIAERLADATAMRWHEFWADDVSLLDTQVFDWSKVLSSRQLTDAYLLALAVRNGGRLVTLDRAVPLTAVRKAEAQHLLCL